MAQVAAVQTEGEQDAARVLQAVDRLLDDHDPQVTPVAEFLGERFDAGLAWVAFPEGHGGIGVSSSLQELVDERMAKAGAQDAAKRNVVGYGMGASIVRAHGTEQQMRRYLRPLFQGIEVWCQLFSEPGAGSDLAGLSTRAVRDGDEWVVNGQKVWTTLAHTAKRAMLLARTDPQVPKHQGLSFFILDMQTPGVEVRPLRQMTGDAAFNEVFLTDVRVPDTDRLGEVGDGWRIALATLLQERRAVSGGTHDRSRDPMAAALALWEKNLRKTDLMRDRLVRLWIRSRIAHQLQAAKAAPGRPQDTARSSAAVKLILARLNQEIYEVCMDLLGMEGGLFPTHYEMRRPETGGFTDDDVRWAFLRARANTIEGGTSEIMRDILAERVLGLPREQRTDKELPWARVRRT